LGAKRTHPNKKNKNTCYSASASSSVQKKGGIKMKKVLWFSRHEMTKEQRKDLERIYGEISINQINKTINSAYELQEEIEQHDVIAIVAPINLQQQFLKLAGEKPVIACRSKRIVDGENNVVFIFDGWYQIIKIDVVTVDL
jgi:hypothetical protein